MCGGVAAEGFRRYVLLAENAAAEFTALDAIEGETQFVEMRIALEREAGRKVFFGVFLHGFLVLVLQYDGDAMEYDLPYFPCLRIQRHATSFLRQRNESSR